MTATLLSLLALLLACWAGRGTWTCKTCKGRGGALWAAFHWHRSRWRSTHPGLDQEAWLPGRYRGAWWKHHRRS